MAESTLDKIEPGKKVKVIQIKGSGPSRRRLLDMGIIPGVEMEVIRKAPLGDPLEYNLRGYNLSLRKAESEKIVVDNGENEK